MAPVQTSVGRPLRSDPRWSGSTGKGRPGADRQEESSAQAGVSVHRGAPVPDAPEGPPARRPVHLPLPTPARRALAHTPPPSRTHSPSLRRQAQARPARPGPPRARNRHRHLSPPASGAGLRGEDGGRVRPSALPAGRLAAPWGGRAWGLGLRRAGRRLRGRASGAAGPAGAPGPRRGPPARASISGPPPVAPSPTPRGSRSGPDPKGVVVRPIVPAAEPEAPPLRHPLSPVPQRNLTPSGRARDTGQGRGRPRVISGEEGRRGSSLPRSYSVTAHVGGCYTETRAVVEG